MWRRRVVSAMVGGVVVAAGVLPAHGQAASGTDIFATAGPAWMWNDESFLGAGGAIGAGVGYGFGRVGLEIVADHRRHSPDFGNDVVFRARETRAAGRLLVYLRASGVQPYVGGAVSVFRIHESTDFPSDCEFVDHRLVCRGRLRSSSSDTARGLSTFAGVRVPVRGGWFVRPEFEFRMGQDRIMMAAVAAVGRRW